MTRILGGLVILLLSVAIPATFSGSLFVYALWIVIGVAGALLLILSRPIQERIPWRLERKDPEGQEALDRIIQLYVLRRDLQTAFQTLGNMDEPSALELRAFADNLSTRVKDGGFTAIAKRMEVHLPDNALPAEVMRRKRALRDYLMRFLIWDDRA